MRGDGRIFQRKDIWWIAYYHRGKEVRESTHSTDEKDAEKLLKHRRNEVGADKLGVKAFVGPKQDRVMVSELLDALEKDHEIRGKKTADFISHLKPIRNAFGDLRAVDCTETVIDRVISEWLKKKRSPGTINREMQLLGQAFKLAVERKRLSISPKITRLPDHAVREGFFERPDFEKVVKHLPADLLDFARFAFLTGWRKGEIASLQWDDVDLQARIINLKRINAKTKKPRKVALEGELWEIIERRKAFKETITENGVRINPLVFHRSNGQRVKDFRKAWTKAHTEGKVHKRVFHDLRRTGVRNMVRSGIPETIAMSISGHRTRSVFDRYNITSEDDLREAAKRMDAYVKALPEKEHGQNTDN